MKPIATTLPSLVRAGRPRSQGSQPFPAINPTYWRILQKAPLTKLADFFGELCPSLVIEFVPKTDSQVQRLLASRKDVFPNYTQEAFEAAFRRYFEIRTVSRIRQTERSLYQMERKPL